MRKTPRLGLLASGVGSNVEAIVSAVERRDLKAEIALIFSDKPEAEVLRLACRRGIRNYCSMAETNAERNEHLGALFEEHDVDVGISAGYLRKIGGKTLEMFPFLNIHPAPLPEFGGQGMWGDAVHQRVIDSGRELTGPTIHLVDEEFDTGHVLESRWCVPVLPYDNPQTLSERIKPVEHELYWRVIDKYLQSPQFQ